MDKKKIVCYVLLQQREFNKIIKNANVEMDFLKLDNLIVNVI